MQLGTKKFKVKEGDEIFIPGNIPHGITPHVDSNGPLEFEYFFPDVDDYDAEVTYDWMKTPKSKF